MPSDTDAFPMPSGLQSGVTPHLLIVTVDSLHANITLFAPTEGRARFIAGSDTCGHGPQRDLPEAFDRLAAKCGYTVSEDMTGVIVVAGPPIALHIIGEPNTTDTATLEQIERFGVARIVVESTGPPRRPTRDGSWCRPIVDRWQNGQIEALLVAVPPGVLPLWAAQLLNALSDMPSPGAARCLVLAPDADLAAAVPPSAIFIARDDHLETHLTGALNRLRAASLLARAPDDATVVSQLGMLARAARAIARDRRKACVYLNVADGTTVVVASDDDIAVYHDPEIDYARGAVRLLRRSTPEQIARWIPLALDTDGIRTWALHRITAPLAPLTDDEDVVIAAAFARAALRPMLAKCASHIPNGATWILGPSLTNLGSHQAALHLIADLMPSVQSAVVSCDGDDVMPAIGALAEFYPTDASSLMAHDVLIPAGTVVQITPYGGRASGITATIACGGPASTIELGADRLTAIGCHGPATLILTGPTANDERIAAQGGLGGVVVDTRRRPLTSVASRAPRPNVSGRLRTASTSRVVNGASHRG